MNLSKYLLERDYKIVEKRKIFFFIPAVIVVIAIIAGIIYGVVNGSPFNLGMDFTGGYTMDVKLGTKLNNDNYSDYVKQIKGIVENLENDEGSKYGLKVASTQMQGSDENASVYVRYKSIKTNKSIDAQKLMEDTVNPKLAAELNQLFRIVPIDISYADGKVTAVYDVVITSGENNAGILGEIRKNVDDFAAEKAILINSDQIYISENDNRTVIIPVSGTIELDELKEAVSVFDGFSGQAVQGDLVSAAVSSELLTNAILAVLLALVLMLVYIAFRFEVSSGIATVLGLAHDILIMLAFITIFNIEINSTFIAALITLLSYSINNTIIVFDRIRENLKSQRYKNRSAADVANTSVRETILRTLNTTITTLFMIGMVAIIGVPSIRIFALPIIVGLLAGVYSTTFVSPTIWAVWKDYVKKREKSVPQREKAVPESKAAQ